MKNLILLSTICLFVSACSTGVWSPLSPDANDHCDITETELGFHLICPGGESFIPRAPEFTGINIDSIIDPCGDSKGPDEILVVLSDGSIMAWYYKQGLVLLEDGNYVTTDKQKCAFSIVNGEYTEAVNK